MGLDMYLRKKIYIGAQYAHRKVKGNIDITVDGRPVKVDFSKVGYIAEDSAYWRKANHIHKWFVDNVQNGVDDCKDYYVSIEKIKELIDICHRILDEKDVTKREAVATVLLPPQEGFFFGSTDYDEYYYGALEETISMLEPLVKNHDPQDHDYYYDSSW